MSKDTNSRKSGAISAPSHTESPMLRNGTSPDQLTNVFGPIVTASSASSVIDLDDDCVQTVLALRSRQLSNDQLHVLERHASEIFATLGLDLETPGTRATPRRFIRALIDATTG